VILVYSSVSCGWVVCEFLAVPVFLTSEGQIRSNLLFLLNGTDPRFWLVGRLLLPWDYFRFARLFERAPPSSVCSTQLTKGAPPKKH
jgi:hypothetical protein